MKSSRTDTLQPCGSVVEFNRPISTTYGLKIDDDRVRTFMDLDEVTLVDIDE